MLTFIVLRFGCILPFIDDRAFLLPWAYLRGTFRVGQDAYI